MYGSALGYEMKFLRKDLLPYAIFETIIQASRMGVSYNSTHDKCAVLGEYVKCKYLDLYIEYVSYKTEDSFLSITIKHQGISHCVTL